MLLFVYKFVYKKISTFITGIYKQQIFIFKIYKGKFCVEKILTFLITHNISWFVKFSILTFPNFNNHNI